MSIRAIFYDLDGTLRTHLPAGRHVFADRAVELGLVITSKMRRRTALWEFSYWADSSDLRADIASFPDRKSFWSNYCWRQLLELGATPEQANTLGPQLNEYMDEVYHPEDVLMDGLHETLPQLRMRNIKLGVISNRNLPFVEYLEELGIRDYFDIFLAAGEVNSLKPNKEIFLHGLRLAGVNASETIYIGDNYFADVVGARNAGLNPVLLDPEGLFEAPDCPVIQSHNQIIPLLERRNLWLGNAN